MKKLFGIVHCVAECRDCEWVTQNHKNGQANAARHARAKGHKVSVEVGMNGYYDGRLDSGKEKPDTR